MNQGLQCDRLSSLGLKPIFTTSAGAGFLWNCLLYALLVTLANAKGLHDCKAGNYFSSFCGLLPPPYFSCLFLELVLKFILYSLPLSNKNNN